MGRVEAQPQREAGHGNVGEKARGRTHKPRSGPGSRTWKRQRRVLRLGLTAGQTQELIWCLGLQKKYLVVDQLARTLKRFTHISRSQVPCSKG